MSDKWTPRIVVFQCQYCLYSEADQKWMDTQLPPHIKLIQVPCTGRISPLFVLNAIQGGTDGILISGCQPEKCHYKEGNLGARRQLDAFRRFLTYLGLEEGRIRFAWIDVSERGRIQQELAGLEKTIQAMGPITRLATRAIPVGEKR
ncbi:MAG: hydrogenase iron-sulfur subunit [Anaerolineae bacterium]|jgi:coenzyme F420-reducing hydrogenase delta subunit|nr:hydrogenase iron-sulfur subunit [Anaerolineae bacterium]MDH7475028.1 hydrogenase iron-sulfur subunit [Anaerolineae bacterium]